MQTEYIAARAKQLQIAALSLVQGMQTGYFRSYFRGQGIEFDSLREYEYGDDVRLIDWNLMARSGKAFVKLYREERDFRMFLIADTSYSMEALSGSQSPRDKMLEIAALLLFAAEYVHSYAGVTVFDGAVSRILSPQRGHNAVFRLLRALEAASGDKRTAGTDLTTALKATVPLLRQRTLVFILSDFKTEGFEKELSVFARMHDTAAVRLASNYDAVLPEAGVLRFQDPETGIERLLPTDSHHFQQQRIKQHAEAVQRWKANCLRCGAFPIEIAGDSSGIQELNRFFLTGTSRMTAQSRGISAGRRM
ncbi:MAG: DUF58 domain-containing protein [Treponema sp.]